MPNKYSHSAVLANYSSRGLISLPNDQYLAYVDSAPSSRDVSRSRSRPHLQPHRGQRSQPHPVTGAEESSVQVATSLEGDLLQPKQTESIGKDEGLVSVDSKRDDEVRKPLQSMKSAQQDTVAIVNFRPSGPVLESQKKSATHLNQTKPRQPKQAPPTVNKSNPGKDLAVKTASGSLQSSDRVTDVRSGPGESIASSRKSSLRGTQAQRSRGSSKSSPGAANAINAISGQEKQVESTTSAVKKPSSRSHTTPVAQQGPHRKLPSSSSLSETLDPARNTTSGVESVHTHQSPVTPRTEAKDFEDSGDDLNAALQMHTADELPRDVDFDGFSDAEEPDFIRRLTVGSKKTQKAGVGNSGSPKTAVKNGYTNRRDSGADSTSKRSLSSTPPQSATTQSTRMNRSDSPPASHQRNTSSSSNTNIGIPSIVRRNPEKDLLTSKPTEIRSTSSLLPEIPRGSFATSFSPRLFENVFASVQDDIFADGTDPGVACPPDIPKFKANVPRVPTDDASDGAVYPPDITKYKARNGTTSPLAQLEAQIASADNGGRQNRFKDTEKSMIDLNTATGSGKVKGGFFSKLRARSLGRKG